MFQRTLPTLKSEDYIKAANELSFFADPDVQKFLRFIGSNKRLARNVILTPFPSAGEWIFKLTGMGILLYEEVHEHCAPSRAYYRVNWKQIRQINKAISLL